MKENYFVKSKYKKQITVKRIYSKKLSVITLLLEIALTLGIIISYKLYNSSVLTYSLLLILTMVFITNYCIKYIKKRNIIVKENFVCEKNSHYYFEKVRWHIISLILVAIACWIYILIQCLKSPEGCVYNYYWVWFIIVLYLSLFEPVLRVVCGFNGNLYMTDSYVVDLSQITSIKIIKEKNNIKTNVYTVHLLIDEEVVGIDRIFEEDLCMIKKIILRNV